MALARGVLVVFAKEPVAGLVKTRLCPPLEPEEAARFYSEMLDDVLDVSARATSRLGLDAVVSVDPPRAVPALADRAPAPFRAVPQRGADLAARMAYAAAEAAAGGYDRILLRGSDSPMFEPMRFDAALEALDAGADLVLCPDRDGGYNLVGLRCPVPGLFDHPMSTASVLDDTLERAREKGLRSELLEPSFDIDEIGDLAELEAGRKTGLASLARRTLAFADRRELWERVARAAESAAPAKRALR